MVRHNTILHTPWLSQVKDIRYRADYELTKGTTYLALMDELWSVFLWVENERVIKRLSYKNTT